MESSVKPFQGDGAEGRAQGRLAGFVDNCDALRAWMAAHPVARRGMLRCVVVPAALMLSVIFIALSLLHVYWALGGRWGSHAVFPVDSLAKKPKMPSAGGTLVVAAGLAGFAALALCRVGSTGQAVPDWLARDGLLVVGGIFALRAVGEFNYVGFFKRRRDTAFARNDTRYYSPLCVVIAVLCGVVGWP